VRFLFAAGSFTFDQLQIRTMKASLFILLCLCRLLPATAQATVTVDAGHIIKRLNGLENGINLDYLMDGSYLDPTTPLSTSVKNMGIKLLRYPGGEKSDNYLWSAAPWTAAAPRMALTDAVACWPQAMHAS